MMLGRGSVLAVRLLVSYHPPYQRIEKASGETAFGMKISESGLTSLTKLQSSSKLYVTSAPARRGFFDFEPRELGPLLPTWYE